MLMKFAGRFIIGYGERTTFFSSRRWCSFADYIFNATIEKAKEGGGEGGKPKKWGRGMEGERERERERESEAFNLERDDSYRPCEIEDAILRSFVLLCGIHRRQVMQIPRLLFFFTKKSFFSKIFVIR